MRALVVYESMFGNTAAIGEAIAATLRSHGMDVEAAPISRIEPSASVGFDLLVVGAPTHAHGMSRTGTRRAAVEDEKNAYAEAPSMPGIRNWLDRLPSGGGGLAAAFDTRFDKPRALTGSAAKGVAKRIARQGFRLVADPESFFVTPDNELAEGQTEHAERWGAALAERASADARG